MSLTLDASVVVAANRAAEPHHAASRQLLDAALHQAARFFCPTLLIPECAAAISRATRETVEAAGLVEDTRRMAHMRLISLDETLAVRGAEIAMNCRIRGADAVYVAVAELFGTTLITWDGEILERAPAVVPTMTPADWLALKAGQPG
jgi:predicted nucleic acid-binding protein